MLADRHWRFTICLLQAFMLLMPLPLLAATGGGDLGRVEELEKGAFGTVHESGTLEARVEELETKYFGKAQSGPIESRLDKLVKSAASKPSGVKLTKLAPQLDHTPEAPPSPAPMINSFRGGPAADDGSANDTRVANLLDQALQLHNQGKAAEAERLFKQALTIDPRNTDAYFNLGAIAEERGDLEGALQFYRSALRFNPQDSDLRQALTSVQNKLEKRKVAQSQVQAQANNQAAQDQKRAQLKQMADEAAAAYRNRNYDVAVRDLETVASQVPDDADVQFGLAQAYRGKGNYYAARLHLARAVTLDPENAIYQKSLYDVTREANQPQTANNSAPANLDGAPPTAPSRFSSQTSAPPMGDVADNSSGPAGQVTPFAPSADDNRPMQGYASQSGGIGGFLGSGMGGGSSSRMQRVMTGSLSGALMGAMMGRGTPGGARSGAMRGALFGGMGGLIFGGF